MNINTKIESKQAPTGVAKLDEHALEAASGGILPLVAGAIGFVVGAAAFGACEAGKQAMKEDKE